MKSKRLRAATRREFSLWAIACGLGGSAATALAQDSAADQAGARELFFGNQRPAQVSERGFRPALPAPSASAQPRITSEPAAQKSSKPTHPGVRVWLTDAAETSGKRKLSPQTVFRTGDRFRLWLQSNRDGYLYLVNVGTSGVTRLMYPRNNLSNHITKGKDFAISSPLVFSAPAGTEQLVVVLSATPIDNAAVQLRDGSMFKVAFRPTLAPTQAVPDAAKPGPGRDSASASLDLALADLRGSKDLKFEDDGTEVVAVSRHSDGPSGAYAPVVVNLRLSHR